MKYAEIFWDAVIKPLEIMIKDPAVAYANIYVSRAQRTPSLQVTCLQC
jgi:hypothetical protein